MKPKNTGSGRFDRQDGRGVLHLQWSLDTEQSSLTGKLEDGTRVDVRHDAFDLALEQLIQALPDGAAPQMCATCALGALEVFAGPNGYEDWSCLKHSPEAARDLKAHGRSARPDSLAELGKTRVCATNVCASFRTADRSN